MANENIGVFRKLNNPSLSWQEKVKVAQHAWGSNECILPNKQQVLLDWVSQQLVDIYKKKKSKDTIKDLWEYLVNILSCLDSKTNHKKTSFVVIPQLLQVFIEVFTSADFGTSDVTLKVLQCGQIILSNSELNLTLVAKFENYLLYMSSLLKTFSNLHQDSIITHKTIHKVFCLLEISLNLYIPLQRRQTNHKKLFEKACQHLLVPIVSVCNLLMGSDQSLLETPQDRIHGFVNLLHQTLSDALFRKEHLSELASSLKALNIQQSSKDTDCQEPKTKKAKIGNYTNELFETLRNQCLQGKNDKDIMKFLPQLFIEFLKARRYNNLKSSSLEFEFFEEMCSLLDVTFKEDEDLPLSSCSVIGLVYTLLDTLLSYDVYQVAEDNSNGKIQFKWFTGFINILIKMKPSNEVFSCLQVLLQLNHYIIEPYLTTVLQICWRSELNNQERGVSQSDLFLSALVKTYTKLRQFDKFIGQMLKSLPDTLDITTKWTGLPKQFQDEMVKACQGLPYGLATSLWKLFNQEIIDNYLPALQILSPQSKGTINNQEKEKIYCFERVVGLYRTFLVNTALGRVAEQHKTEAIVTNLTNLCSDMHDKVLDPALEVLSHIADNKLYKSVSTSVLVLYHTLQEMNTYLGTFGLISHDVHSKIATHHWNKYLLTHFNQEQKKKGRERLVFIKVLIAIQRLRIYLRSVVLPVEENETQKLLDFLFHWFEDPADLTANSSWNLQLWSINTATFDAAYWFTLCSFAPILLTLCTDKQRQQFTYYLIKTLLHQNVDSIQDHDSDITLQLSSKTLLFSAGFHQIPSMQQCFVGTLWTEISKLLSNSSEIHNKLHKIMVSAGMTENQSDSTGVEVSADNNESSSEEESSSDEESEELVTMEKADNIPQAVTSLVSTGKVLADVLEKLYSGDEHLDALDCETARKISEHLALLTLLPLDWLSDSNHVGCFLALLACDAVAYSIQDEDLNEESLRVSFVSQRLLTVFLQGCISKKRYLIHHVVDIDCLLSWMLMSCLRIQNVEVSSFSGQVHNVSIELLMVLMKFALKIGKPLTLIDGFVQKIFAKLDSLTTKITDKSRKSIHKALKREQSLLQVAGAVMNVLEKVISCKTSRLNEIKMAVHVFSKCAPPILSLLQAMTTKHTKKNPKENEDKAHDILQDNHVLIDSYSAVIHIYSISQTSRKFTRSKEIFQELQWRPLLDLILSFATESIIITKQTASSNGSNEEEQLLIQPSMKSSLNFLNIIMSSPETLQVEFHAGFHKDLLDSILSFLHHLDSSAVDMKEVAVIVILSMLQGCPSDMAVELLKELNNALALHAKSSRQISSCMQIWLSLLTGKFFKARKRELRSVLSQVLIALQSIAQQSTDFNLKILSLELMTRIMSLGPNMLYPHHSSLVFHGCLLVQLDHNSQRFPELFCTQFSLLSTALFHHSDAVFKTMHVFMACVTNMLNSLCHYCKILDKTKERSQDTQTMCADKMSRLYQEIASHKATISKYIPYMIAEYIQQIQEHQLQENIKKLLEAGMYCLIDACGEHEMALLHTTLDRGSRELFSTLLNDYNKFYKFKGKI